MLAQAQLPCIVVVGKPTLQQPLPYTITMSVIPGRSRLLDCCRIILSAYLCTLSACLSPFPGAILFPCLWTYLYFCLQWSLPFKSGPCLLRPPLQSEKYGLKVEMVLKLRYIYTEYIMVTLIPYLKMEGVIK